MDLQSAPALTSQEQEEIEYFLSAKGLPLQLNVTFGDVVLPEQYSAVTSRSHIRDFSTLLVPGFEIARPLVSANMESVSGTTLITEIEKLGGIGIPPQTLPPKELLKILEQVAQEDCAFRTNCLTVRTEQTIAQVRALAEEHGISGFIVINSAGFPTGILSARDWKYERDDSKHVNDVMGGGRLRPLITATPDISFDEAARLLAENRIEKLPLIDENSMLVGAIFANGLFYTRDHPHATRNDRGQFIRIGAIGVGQRFEKKHLHFVEQQIIRGITAILVDTARAYSVNAREAIKQIRKHFPELPIIAGNISTPEGAKALIEWGADCVKVGQGPGEACRTREVGVGVPQLSAGAKCSVIAHRYGKTIMFDGGMKSPGDIAKALAAGADTVMLGFLFAGTHESAALATYNAEGILVKDYEGSASFEAQRKRHLRGSLDHVRRPEGIKRQVLVQESLASRVANILDGLRSAFSYAGAASLKDFREVARFELQTNAGLFEGIKHN